MTTARRLGGVRSARGRDLPEEASPLLSAQGVTYGYAGRNVLEGVKLAAEGGEFLVLMGANGAGKSTLLDLLAGLRAPAAGEIRLRGRALRALPAKQRARAISHLPQGTRGDLPFTVEQIVLMGCYAQADRWFESSQDHAQAEDAMRRMDCLMFRQRRFATLSGGEQQRVLLAACIAQCPRVMLWDEPSTYLDVHQQLQCFGTLAALAREGALCIAVTHDLNLALAHCSRLLILDRGVIAADFSTRDAAAAPEWLALLSPRLRLGRTPEGAPWVMYR